MRRGGRMHWKSSPAGTVLLLLLAGCTLLTGPSRVASTADVYVSIHGPRDWEAQVDYVLEIGGLAFRIDKMGGGGVAGVPTTQQIAVRLVRPSDCYTLVAFMARPGSGWTIQFDSQEQPTVTELGENQVRNLGPALVERQPTGCPPAS